MNGTESKDRWHEQHAELRREYERARSRRRKSGGLVTRRIAASERRLNRTAWQQQPENRKRRNELSRAAYARRKAELEKRYS